MSQNQRCKVRFFSLTPFSSITLVRSRALCWRRLGLYSHVTLEKKKRRASIPTKMPHEKVRRLDEGPSADYIPEGVQLHLNTAQISMSNCTAESKMVMIPPPLSGGGIITTTGMQCWTRTRTTCKSLRDSPSKTHFQTFVSNTS